MIMGQRINTNGVVQWLSNGTDLSMYYGTYEINYSIVSDGTGGFFIAYCTDYHPQICVDRFSIDAFPYGPVTTVEWGELLYPKVVSDGSGGCIVTFKENYICAMKVDVSFALGNYILINNSQVKTDPIISSDGSGGAIICWTDNRGNISGDNIYAQNVDRYGYLGDMAPSIAKVKDIINDQGGKVNLLWDRSYLDTYTQDTITQYKVYCGLKSTIALAGKTDYKLDNSY